MSLKIWRVFAPRPRNVIGVYSPKGLNSQTKFHTYRSFHIFSPMHTKQNCFPQTHASIQQFSRKAHSDEHTVPIRELHRTRTRYRIILLLTCAGLGSLLYLDFMTYDELIEASRLWNFEWDEGWRRPVDIVVDHDEGSDRPRFTHQYILVRHGQYECVDSEYDSQKGLTPLGQTQAELTGKRLAELFANTKVDRIVHSDMKRAEETADIVCRFFPDVDRVRDPLLAEGVPEWPSPPCRTCEFDDAQIERDGERIEMAFEKYFYRPTNTNATTIVICHGNVIRYLLCKSLQLPTTAWLRFATYNCGLTWLKVDNEGYVSCREFGGVSHMPGNMLTYH